MPSLKNSTMTPKQTALSQLARLALNAASEMPAERRADVCRTVAVALLDDCPQLSKLASRAASQLSESTDTITDLLEQLNLQ